MASRNVSLDRFRKLTDDLKREVLEIAVSELNVQADGLVATMESVAPRGETGDLIHSIKKIPGKSPTQVRILAGGQETVRESVSSKPYDYSRADEFGTQKMKARPFFWPSYRLKKKRMIAAMKRKLTAAIKKRSAE